MARFIKESSDIKWIHEMLELPFKNQNGKYVYKNVNELVNVHVRPEEYANVKGQPAKNASEFEKWGDLADIIILCRLLDRSIVCVQKENSSNLQLAKIHLPDDQIQVLSLEY